ncbi:hypothetical protein PL321_04870 [Caloramator sp. mosi_1]|uniref:hypothetical protein n=1 Tax=Caloramator sp. mosi_1 TaxID=3023090 RepID=UPI00235F1C00|nr:hypothetical protein [Caloramator sp. mosi_1]WDC84908.1 hypothetical protein PL321_04870 [Caloramator sp. mosi_1]
MIGVSKNVPLNIRQKLAFSKTKLRETLIALKEIVEGCIILSTCNRTEIYIEGEKI